MTTETTIFKRITDAMCDVHILGKGERNAHQGYNFAGIDAFLEMVNPIVRKHGISLHITESEQVSLMDVTEKKGPATFARYVYQIHVTSIDGDSTDKSQQTVFLRFVGPQTTGQSLAYAVKMYWRFLLQIPTGDKDADLQEQIIQPERKPKTPEEAIKEIEAIGSIDELGHYWRNLNTTDRHAAQDAGVIEAKDARKAELSPPKTDASLEDDKNFLEEGK